MNNLEIIFTNGSEIKEVEEEIVPTLEKILEEMDISRDKILINVGDSKLTKDNSVSEANDVDAVKKMVEEMVKDSDDAYHMFSPELFMDRLNNVLVSCYIESDRFEDALPYAKAMKESKRVNFANFGYYIESLAMQKLAQENKKDKAEAEKIYQYAVAYYRKKMMDDPSDITAAVFRARLYAENGKYELAEQVAGMLDDQAMQSLQEYIDECRETAAK